MLSVKNLKKNFRDADGKTVEVLFVKELSIEQGSQIAITGESGCGKSTLLNVISGILKADEGSVSFDGNDITKLSESKRDIFRAKNIGYVFQTFNLLQGFTALENVMLAMMFSGKTSKDKATGILESMGLKGKLNKLPKHLSAGEQQRVAIARAVVNSPKIILADEPTSNLDSKNSTIVIDLLKNTCREKNISLLIVSHEKDVIESFELKRSFSEINFTEKTV